MLVDIIIPTYNSGIYLRDAINSCYKQTYKNFNIIVIDDASEEDLTWVSREYPKVKYIRNDKNIGPAASRNVGIASSSGELISMLDADDIMHNQKLSMSVNAFTKNPNIGMVCGNYQILVNRKSLLRPFYKNPISISYQTLMRQNLVASGSVTMRRDVVNSVGMFDEKYWISEDYDMWLRISEAYPIHYIHEIMYFYSVIPKGGSLTQRDDIQRDHIANINEIRNLSIERMKNKK
jgi:glycosyltransferase involved in cell wall biosynthesis